tara:strand:- start:482 stop:688 length:207 start_codon:yes stop_codon:yes gene_type:complete
MKKKYILRGSEVVEYELQIEAKDLADAKSKFSQQLSSVTWYKKNDLIANYTGFQWDICEEVTDDETGD